MPTTSNRSSIDNIATLWHQFLKLPFPEAAHTMNLDLELIDSNIAGCISSFINQSKLEPVKLKILQISVKELQEKITKHTQIGSNLFQTVINNRNTNP